MLGGFDCCALGEKSVGPGVPANRTTQIIKRLKQIDWRSFTFPQQDEWRRNLVQKYRNYRVAWKKSVGPGVPANRTTQIIKRLKQIDWRSFTFPQQDEWRRNLVQKYRNYRVAWKMPCWRNWNILPSRKVMTTPRQLLLPWISIPERRVTLLRLQRPLPFLMTRIPFREIQEPKASPPASKTSAAAQLDELMAHLCEMQRQVTVKADASKKPVSDEQDHKASLDSMLGGLEQDLQNLGIATVLKGHCASCKKPIAGKVIHALGQAWHPEHFVCAHCKGEIGSSPFFERSGLAYCAEDYHRLFSPRCAYCAAPILDKVLTAMNQTWHPEHFFCAHCGEVFGEEGFHEKDKKPYCRKDFLGMFAPRCGGCNRPVLENYLSAMGTVWHPECFVCRDCFSGFSTGSFFELDGRPFCELHYHQRRGTLCRGCGQPITGRCVSAMGHKFHPEHFVCAFCLTQLSKGVFKEQNDKTYCHACFSKLFPV